MVRGMNIPSFLSLKKNKEQINLRRLTGAVFFLLPLWQPQKSRTAASAYSLAQTGTRLTAYVKAAGRLNCLRNSRRISTASTGDATSVRNATVHIMRLGRDEGRRAKLGLDMSALVVL